MLRLPSRLRVAAAFALAVALAPITGAETLPPASTPFLRIVHVQSVMEVDGERVEFDELVECRPWRRPGINIRRPYLSKNVRTGTVILLVLGQMCDQWPDTSYTAPPPWSRQTLSDRFLPRIYFTDSMTAPSFVEAYYSEAYHEQARRRVVLRTFSAKLTPYPVSDELLRRARTQEAAEPKADFFRRDHTCGLGCWWSYSLGPIRPDEWGQEREIAARIGAHASEQLLFLPSEQLMLLSRFLGKIVNWSLLPAGVPRRGEDTGLIGFPPRSGITGDWRVRLAQTADELIPVRCEGEVCRPLFGEQGYVIFYPKDRYYPVAQFKWVEIRGQQIPIHDIPTWRGGIYDPVTRSILFRVHAFK